VGGVDPAMKEILAKPRRPARYEVGSPFALTLLAIEN
jgi:hypothetical protein